MPLPRFFAITILLPRAIRCLPSYVFTLILRAAMMILFDFDDIFLRFCLSFARSLHYTFRSPISLFAFSARFIDSPICCGAQQRAHAAASRYLDIRQHKDVRASLMMRAMLPLAPFFPSPFFCRHATPCYMLPPPLIFTCRFVVFFSRHCC